MTKAAQLCASAAICALMTAASAHAQTSPSPSPTSSTLGEVVVTAQRREETLQKAAIAISAVTGSELQRAGVGSTADLTRTAPSIVIAPSPGNAPQVYLRGVGTFVANAYAEQAVAVNFDGVYISRPGGANGFFYDLQRVEILKGPQGTLYGRNATGGALNVLPEQPKLGGFSGFVNGEIGNYNEFKVDGAVNIPVNETTAVRVAGSAISRDGYLSDGYNDDKGYAVRAQVLSKPVEGWTLRGSTDYYHAGGKGFAQVQYPFADPSHPWRGPSDPVSVAALIAGLPPAAKFSALNLLPKSNGFTNDNFWGIHGQVDGDLGFATLTVLPAYRKTDEDYLNYVPSSFRVTSRAEQKSLETRLASNALGATKWVVGAYYFDEHVGANQDYNHGIQETVTNSTLTDKTVAAFGQGTLGLTDTFRLTGGARYTHETKSQDSLFATRTFTPILPPLTHRVDSKAWDSVTWKVGAEYDLAPRTLLYANIGTGFKAGGFFASAGPDSFDPERLTAYSVGVKNRFWDNRLQLNAEVFDYEYTNQQISHLGPVQTGVPASPYAPVFLTENVGRSRIFGAELEGSVLITPDDLFTVDVQRLDAKYTNFVYNYYSTTGSPPSVGCSYVDRTSSASPLPTGAGKIFSVDCSGKQGNNAPDWTTTVSLQHTFHIADKATVTAQASSYFSTQFYTAFDYLQKQIQNAYTMSNATLTYAPTSQRWSVSAFVNNIENAAVVSTSFQPNQALGNGLNFAALRPPRTYGMRVGAKF